MQVKIFVSYTTKDNHIQKKYLAEKESFLSKYGQVYIDLLHNDSTDKQRRVFDELISSNVLVLIKSESIFKSKWVIWEVVMAQKKLIPVIIIDSTFTESDIEYQFAHLPKKSNKLLHRKNYSLALAFFR